MNRARALQCSRQGQHRKVTQQVEAQINLEHTRHRSATNAFVNICAGLVAYSFYERKPVARVYFSDRLLTAGEPNRALAA